MVTTTQRALKILCGYNEPINVNFNRSSEPDKVIGWVCMWIAYVALPLHLIFMLSVKMFVWTAAINFVLINCAYLMTMFIYPYFVVLMAMAVIPTMVMSLFIGFLLVFDPDRNVDVLISGLIILIQGISLYYWKATAKKITDGRRVLDKWVDFSKSLQMTHNPILQQGTILSVTCDQGDSITFIINVDVNGTMLQLKCIRHDLLICNIKSCCDFDGSYYMTNLTFGSSREQFIRRVKDMRPGGVITTKTQHVRITDGIALVIDGNENNGWSGKQIHPFLVFESDDICRMFECVYSCVACDCNHRIAIMCTSCQKISHLSCPMEPHWDYINMLCGLCAANTMI